MIYSQVGFGSTDEGSEFALVLALDILKGKDSSGLLVDDRAETSLSLDDHIRDTHLAAESGKEYDELDRVDIVGDDDEGSLLGFDECNNVVETVFDEERLLVLGSLLLFGGGFGDSLKTFLLLGLGLGAVSVWWIRTHPPLLGLDILVEKLEQLGSRVLVQGVGELRNGGRHLETLTKDDFLPLKTNVFGPLDEAGQVGLGTNVLTYNADQRFAPSEQT